MGIFIGKPGGMVVASSGMIGVGLPDLLHCRVEARREGRKSISILGSVIDKFAWAYSGRSEVGAGTGVGTSGVIIFLIMLGAGPGAQDAD